MCHIPVSQQRVCGQHGELWGHLCWCPQLWAAALPQPWTQINTHACIYYLPWAFISSFFNLCASHSLIFLIFWCCALFPGRAVWRCFYSLNLFHKLKINPWVSSSSLPPLQLHKLVFFPYFPAESCSRAVRLWKIKEVTWGRILSLQLVFLLTPPRVGSQGVGFSVSSRLI